uniref:Uncharacterized protein n=1 Tax=Romanomermis culicivorax TaxID=13658 RepID=A0A915HR17_ROMCU
MTVGSVQDANGKEAPTACLEYGVKINRTQKEIIDANARFILLLGEQIYPERNRQASPGMLAQTNFPPKMRTVCSQPCSSVQKCQPDYPIAWQLSKQV